MDEMAFLRLLSIAPCHCRHHSYLYLWKHWNFVLNSLFKEAQSTQDFYATKEIIPTRPVIPYLTLLQISNTFFMVFAVRIVILSLIVVLAVFIHQFDFL